MKKSKNNESVTITENENKHKKNKKIIFTIIFIVIFLPLVAILALKLFVKFNMSKEQVPVLMYHQVVYDEYYNNQSDTISISMFEKQLNYLKENNYKTLTLDEFYCWKKNKCEIPDKSVLLTFDDGFYSFHYLVEPLLEKYDMHAVSFLIGNTIGETTKKYNSEEYGTIGKDLLYNHSEHVEYQSHSYAMHKEIEGTPRVYHMSKIDIRNDINKMNEIYNFQYIAYPYNTDTDNFIEMLKTNGYKLAFRGESEKATKDCNDYQISRIGVSQDFEAFKAIFETDKHTNRYGNGLIRKILVTIERKFKVRIA